MKQQSNLAHRFSDKCVRYGSTAHYFEYTLDKWFIDEVIRQENVWAQIISQKRQRIKFPMNESWISIGCLIRTQLFSVFP